MKLTVIIDQKLFSSLEEMAEQLGESVGQAAGLIIADYVRVALDSKVRRFDFSEAAAILGDVNLNSLKMSELKRVELAKAAWQHVVEFASQSNVTTSRMANLIIADYLRRADGVGIKSIQFSEALLELKRGASLPTSQGVKELAEAG